jgi:hypothetical protein
MVTQARSAPSEHRTIHEPSAWLRGAAAKRVRQIENLHLDASAFGVIVSPLGSSGPPGSRADRECDRCGSYVPQAGRLHLFAYRPTPRIFLCAGMCASCAKKEDAR